MIDEKDLSQILIRIREKYPEIDFEILIKIVDEILIFIIEKEG